MYNQLVTVHLIVLPIVCFLAPVNSNHVVTQISIYYETLCPDSKDFFLRQLAPVYEKLNRYMDVELVPFGNANVSYPRHDNKPVFHCQHGPAECYGNRAQACVIEMLKNTEVSINYIKCMFAQSDWRETSATAEKCAQQLGLDWPKIKTCTDGSEGERLLIANSLKTFNLSPEHTSIPWIVIEKNHSEEMQERASKHLLKYLCESFFGQDSQLPQCKEEAIASLSQQANGSEMASAWIGLPVLLALVHWSRLQWIS